MNRLLFRKSIICVVILVITAFSVLSFNNHTFAYELINTGKCGDNATYNLYDNGVLEITGEGNIFDYTPSNIPWASFSDTISSVVIGDGITGIGASAFYNIKISSIEIPSSINYIGGNSLGYTSEGRVPNFKIIGEAGSSAETYATQNGFVFAPKSTGSPSGKCGSDLYWQLLSDGVLTVYGSGDMSDYSSFSETPWSNYASKHNGYQIKSVLISSGVSSVGNNAFKGCREISSVSLPDSLKKIGISAFENCSSLLSVSFSSNLSEIQDNAFLACSSLSAVTFNSAGQLKIGNNAFSLTAIKNLTLPSCVTSIGSKSFYGCTNLEDVKILSPNIIPEKAFASCTSIKSVTLPNTLKSIQNSAFEDCTSLTQISVPQGTEEISDRAFFGCSLLSKIELPDTVTALGEYSFSKCVSLTSVILGNGLETIEEGLFEDCKSLCDVKIGNKVSTIRSRAFLNCPVLKKITLPNSVHVIEKNSIGFLCSENQDDNVFSKNTDFTIYSYSPSQAGCYAAKNEFNFVSLGQVESDGGYVTEEVKWTINTYTGVLMITGSGTVPDYIMFSETPWHLYADYIKTVVYGSGVKNIGTSSFEGCHKLSFLSIAGTVSEIGDFAFADTSLISLTLPSGVLKIHDSAFEGCLSLNSVTLSETLEYIGPNAFRGLPLLKSIYIPQSVTYIGSYSFGFSGDNSPVDDFVVRGNKNSTAENYASEYSIDFREDGHIEIENKESDCTVSVLGSNPSKFTLSFKVLKTTLEPDIFLAKNEYAIVYEIALNEYDLPAKIEGTALISFPTPENINPIGIKIFHMSEDGKLTQLDFTTYNGKISFSNTSLGKFVITNADLNELYDITVNYQFEDGTIAAPSATFKATMYAQYKIASLQIDGYISNEKTVTGSVNDNAVITFTYKPESLGNVTEKIPSDTDDGEKDYSGAKLILLIAEIVLIVGIIAGALALFFISRKKNKGKVMQPLGDTIKITNDKFSDTIIVPDAPTREIDVKSLFTDEPQEDKVAENLHNNQVKKNNK